MAHSEKQLLCFKGASSWREPASGIPYILVLDLLFCNTHRTAFGTNKWEHPGEPFFIALSWQTRIREVLVKNCQSLQSRLVCAGWDRAAQNCEVMHKGHLVLCSGKFVHWKASGLDRPEHWTWLWRTNARCLWKCKADLIVQKPAWRKDIISHNKDAGRSWLAQLTFLREIFYWNEVQIRT